jgi:hypothetical protein
MVLTRLLLGVGSVTAYFSPSARGRYRTILSQILYCIEYGLKVMHLVVRFDYRNPLATQPEQTPKLPVRLN